MKEAFKKAIIDKGTNIKLSDIIRFASQYLPDEYPDSGSAWKYFWEPEHKNDRGRRPITTDDEIMCYLSAYGDMHWRKLRLAFDQLISKVSIPANINIVDWGCGQGLASLSFLDYLNSKGINVSVDNVILIEPSKLALEYAELYLHTRLGDSAKIKTVQKYFSTLEGGDFLIEGEAPVFHLYSNILDVDGIAIKDLAQWLRNFRQRDNYIICASPWYRSGNARIDAFFSYFNQAVPLGQLEESDKTRNKDANFTYNIRLAKLLAEADKRVRDLRFFAPRQFHGAYRLDTFKDIDKELFRPYSVFDIYANYEIGSSYHDDIDPIYAVLSNIITRGLPTKASPYIEEKLNEVYGNSRKVTKYGAINYDGTLADSKVEDIALMLESMDFSRDDTPLIMTPIAVARIQKAIIEALITEGLSIEKPCWKVVIEEADVPCAALALNDLQELFTNLVELSENYRGRTFPQIELTIVNSRFKDSPLHLGNKVYSSSEEVPVEDYDLVIDYSSSRKGEDEYVFSKYNVKPDGCYLAIFSADNIVAQRYVYTTDLIEYRALTSTDETGQFIENGIMVGTLEYFLQLIFRKEHFRMGQLPILNRALKNKSVIGLLPTGGGKSLTYQLAAMLQPGVTVVIDPLRSLMQDQYDGLVANGIDCCTFINASVDKREREQREYQIVQSQCLFAFMSPERLCIYGFRKRLKNMFESNVYFSYGVIDEVHCVSEWGQDFRFTYLHLGRNLYNFVKSKTGVVTLFGLTATASFDVLADVERELSGNGAYELDSDVLVRCEDTNRLELQYRIIPVQIEFGEDKYYNKKGKVPQNLPHPYQINKISRSEGKSDALPGIISAIPEMERELMEKRSVRKIVKHFYERQNKDIVPNAGDHLGTAMPDDFATPKEIYEQAGIVFCPHKGKTAVSVDVNADKLKETIPDVGIFYSSDKEVEETENLPMKNMVEFRDNHQAIMVATKAFGMGIDKPNVRFTVNMNYSNSLEAFVQEAGRAGRDRSMALSTILVSDYNLIKLNRGCKYTCKTYNDQFRYVKSDIENRWFKEEDLDDILDYYSVTVNKESECTRCNPNVDLVRLACEKNQEQFQKFNFKTGCGCQEHGRCTLERLKSNFPGWGLYSDLLNEAQQVGAHLVGRNIEYQSPDYQNMMYFYSQGYPGTLVEKKVMQELMANLVVSTGMGDTKEVPDNMTVQKGFLDLVLSKKPGEEVVAIISYENLDDAAFSKAIYRMCCIGLIDDFTRDYDNKKYRVVCRRKQDGGYYEYLKDFLMRYYPEDKASREVEKAKEFKGQNEVHRCLAYLTDFIYEKLAVKKKRAIDDIRNFCNIGLNKTKDWKDVNEELKDYIYYYFNSKFAKKDYIADNGEPYSLTVDTDFGKESPLDVVSKYIRVTEDEICGSSGNPIDNIKHLQGAVRLILRSLTRENPVIELLNVFCILCLKEYRNNAAIQQTLEQCYTNAYRALWEEFDDKKEFYSFFESFKKNIFSHGADRRYKTEMEMIEVNAETTRYRDFLTGLGWDKGMKKQ